MPDSICFAAEALFDAVQTRFDDEGTEVAMLFGWRKPPKHKVAQSRIVWVPGDQDNIGLIGAPRGPGGGDARPLGQLAELFTIQVAGFDPTSPQDERAQYNATRCLFDAWYRAMYLAAHGNARVVSLRWKSDRREVAHGFEIHAVLEIDSPIPDAPYAFAPVDVGAEIADQLAEASELITVENTE